MEGLRLKTNKGFTLIEIMIVIAIIGILALVLVPKIGSMKDQAKLAGVDTNMRVLEGIAQGMMTSYKATADAGVTNGIDDFEDAIYGKLPSDVENPLTNAPGKDTLANVQAGASKAFAYIGGDLAAHQGGQPAAPTDIEGDLKGCVVFTTWTSSDSSSDVNVTIYPYDEAGSVIAAKVKTLTK